MTLRRVIAYVALMAIAPIGLAQQQEIEPGVNTSPGMPTRAEPAQPMTPSAAPASPSAPAARGTAAPAPPAAAKPATAAGKPTTARTGKAMDRLELESTQITGNRELPKVLYIVPWKAPELGDLAGRPANSLLDEVLAPVDRDVFRRQNRYYDALKPDAPNLGGAAPAAAPSNASPVNPEREVGR